MFTVPAAYAGLPPINASATTAMTIAQSLPIRMSYSRPSMSRPGSYTGSTGGSATLSYALKPLESSHSPVQVKTTISPSIVTCERAAARASP